MLHNAPRTEPVPVELPLVGECDETATWGAAQVRQALQGINHRPYENIAPDLLRARVTPAPKCA